MATSANHLRLASGVLDVATKALGLGLLFSAVTGVLAVLPLFLFLSGDIAAFPTGWGWWWAWVIVAVGMTAGLFYEVLGVETTPQSVVPATPGDEDGGVNPTNRSPAAG